MSLRTRRSGAGTIRRVDALRHCPFDLIKMARWPAVTGFDRTVTRDVYIAKLQE